MIQMAAWKKHSRTIGVESIPLHRGEFIASLRYLATRWKWTVKAIRGFLKQLVGTDRIRAQRGARAGTVYLLTNYHAYQTGGTVKGTAKGKVRAQQGHSEGTKEKAGKQGSKEENNYTPEFEEAWTHYPTRLGGNSKLAAWRQWSARITEGVSPETLLAGTKRYATEVRDKVGTPFVRMASTFYGRDRHFEYEDSARITRDAAVRRALNVLRSVDESRIPINGFGTETQFQAWLSNERDREAAA